MNLSGNPFNILPRTSSMCIYIRSGNGGKGSFYFHFILVKDTGRLTLVLHSSLLFMLNNLV